MVRARDKQLPTRGPGLLPFTSSPGRVKNIEYIKLLSSLDPEDENYGSHSYVFKAFIDSEPYAIKVVSSKLPNLKSDCN
jgi:hypothetical protein